MLCRSQGALSPFGVSWSPLCGESPAILASDASTRRRNARGTHPRRCPLSTASAQPSACIFTIVTISFSKTESARGRDVSRRPHWCCKWSSASGLQTRELTRASRLKVPENNRCVRQSCHGAFCLLYSWTSPPPLLVCILRAPAWAKRARDDRPHGFKN